LFLLSSLIPHIFICDRLLLFAHFNDQIYLTHIKNFCITDEDERSVHESPFERLKRRALMKKLQTEEFKKLNMSPPAGEGRAPHINVFSLKTILTVHRTISARHAPQFQS
jgi:hypothetical protein